jgi:AraC-like DNA-binding protein
VESPAWQEAEFVSYGGQCVGSPPYSAGVVSDYREFRPPGRVRAVVACVWEQRPAVDHTHRVVPDGCLDLIWLASRELVVAGADTGPRLVDLPAGALTTGLRLRPGAAGAVLGLPAAELRDRQIDAAAVWGRAAVTLRESLAEASPEHRRELLVDSVVARDARPDGLILAAARRLALPQARVAAVAAELGVSERQLHRRMLTAVGYGPKMLARVARLRRLIALEGHDLAARALAAGYASQAHMNDEVRRLTGTTPVRFLEDARLTAA